MHRQHISIRRLICMLALTAVACAMLTHCTKEPATDKQTSPNGSLSFALAPGTTLETRKHIVQHISTSTAAGKTGAHKTYVYGTTCTLDTFTPDGGYRYRRGQRYFQYAPSAELDAGAYDSRTSPDTDIPPALWTQAKESGEQLLITISAKGAVAAISDPASLREHMRQKGAALFGKETTARDPGYRYQIDSYYSDDQISSRIAAEHELSPVMTHQPGERWQSRSEQPGGIVSSFEYSYIADQGDLARVELVQMISRSDNRTQVTEEKTASARALQSFAFDRIEGGSRGTLLVVKKTGWIFSGRIEQDYTYISSIPAANGKKETTEVKYTGYTEYSSEVQSSSK